MRTTAILFLMSSVMFTHDIFAQKQVNLDSGLVAYYMLDGNSADSSVNSNHGMDQVVTDTADRFGNSRSAYYFNGINSRVTIADHNSLDFGRTGDGFTISFWAKFLDSTNYRGIIQKGGGTSGSTDYTVYQHSGNNELVFTTGECPNPASCMRTGAYPPNESWHHILAQQENLANGSFKRNFWVNGVKVKSETDTFKNSGNTFPLYLGYQYSPAPGNWYLHGMLDEVRLYNRPVNDCEISQLHEEYTINPRMMALDSFYCESDPRAFIDPQPSGGTFSDNRVANGRFDVADFSVGVHNDIVYTYTDSNSCVWNDTFDIVVKSDTNCNTTSLNESLMAQKNLVDYKVMPNPSRGEISILFKAEQQGTIRVKVFNNTGQIVFEKQTNSTEGLSEINLVDWKGAPGTYFIQVSAESGISTKRFIVY